MKRKQFTLSLLSLSLISVLCLSSFQVQATDFKNKENHYIKLCSSSKLTSKQQKTCKKFNTYLYEKNQSIIKDSKETKEDVKKTKKTLENIEKEIATYTKKIDVAEKELTYINKNITSLNKQVKKKKKLLEERLYTMQTSLNSHMFISYLYSAKDITDFIRRAINVQEITSYENNLIEDLNNDISEVEKQKKTVSLLKQSLQKNETAQKKLQKQYFAQLAKQNGELASNSSKLAKNQESMESIQKNLAAIKKASDASRVGYVSHATPKPAKPSKPSKPSSSDKDEDKKPANDTNNNHSNKDETAPSKPSNSNTQTSSEKLGLKIANKALTRQGYMYVWGGCHSASALKNPKQTQFDCSGLVCWAHYQCGVNIGVQSTKYNLATYGKSVSKKNMQAGDIILFSSNGSYSGVHHVGIYIGDNKMVHAPSTGKAIQVANLNYSYWQKEWYTVRRCY